MRKIPLTNTKEQMQNVTTKQLKMEVMKAFSNTQGPIDDNVQLYFKGQKLDNDRSPLSEYGIQHESVIQVVRRVHGG
ncbi:uncharacterized protein zgc:194655 [Lates japonicus]